MTDKTGGPAFPSEYTQPRNIGMTLRDYFASAALQGLCAGFSAIDSRWPRDDEPEGYDVVAEHAYHIADAMLKARQR